MLRFRIELPPVELSENSITALALALMVASPAVESSGTHSQLAMSRL